MTIWTVKCQDLSSFVAFFSVLNPWVTISVPGLQRAIPPEVWVQRSSPERVSHPHMKDAPCGAGKKEHFRVIQSTDGKVKVDSDTPGTAKAGNTDWKAAAKKTLPSVIGNIVNNCQNMIVEQRGIYFFSSKRSNGVGGPK